MHPVCVSHPAREAAGELAGLPFCSQCFEALAGFCTGTIQRYGASADQGADVIQMAAPQLSIPRLGQVVLYRSRTGTYDVPAMVTCNVDSLNPRGVAAGGLPGLTGLSHVHLAVFTPGIPGRRIPTTDFITESPHGRAENIGGIYQEWDIGPAWEVESMPGDPLPPPGTWRWS